MRGRQYLVAITFLRHTYFLLVEVGGCSSQYKVSLHFRQTTRRGIPKYYQHFPHMSQTFCNKDILNNGSSKIFPTHISFYEINFWLKKGDKRTIKKKKTSYPSTLQGCELLQLVKSSNYFVNRHLYTSFIVRHVKSNK